MGERGLTFRQQRFAKVAAGCTKAEAFRRAYPSDRRGNGTLWEGAKRVGRVPKVKAEIQRLTLLRSPHDAAAQAEHVAARLLELTKDPDPAVALRAIAQWGKLVEAGLLKPHSAADDAEKARLVDELMALYHEEFAAEGQAEPLRPLTPDQREDAAAVIDVESEEMPPMSEVEAPPIRSLLPSTDKDDAGRPVLEEAPEESAVYEWKSLPGYFGKPRRVRVRVR